MHRVFIGIGANLGDKVDNLLVAIGKMKERDGIKIIKQSEWYKTNALTVDSFEKQPKYINGVVEIKTTIEPAELLTTLKMIEREMGRSPSKKKWIARIIDLDILFYDDLVLTTEHLTIPHKEILNRMFVLKPMADLDPDFVHPKLKKTISELMENLKFKGATC